MNEVIKELVSSGVLTEAMVQWAQAHQTEYEIALDTALLELDLIDEEGLIGEMESYFGIQVARPQDLLQIDSNIGETLPDGFSRSFSLCPVGLVDNQLVALVESPLPKEAIDELRDLFGFEIKQLLAPSHLMDLAKSKVYAIPLNTRILKLEEKLNRRRNSINIHQVLDSVISSATLPAVIADVLDYAASLMEFSCFMVYRDDELRVAATRGEGIRAGKSIAPPDMDCSLGAAIRYGSYFVGPIKGTPGDKRFYQALERPLPSWAFVAPIPTAGKAKFSFCADNGPLGIATRWVAEISLLTSRLGQKGKEPEISKSPERSSNSVEEAFESLIDPKPKPQNLSVVSPKKPVYKEATQAVEPPPVQITPEAVTEKQIHEVIPMENSAESRERNDEMVAGSTSHSILTAAEQTALDQLRNAALEANCPIDVFLEDLLKSRKSQPSTEDTVSLVGEVKDLFDKLATDIPTQLARGMEAAFRNLVPNPASPQPTVGSASVSPTRKAAEIKLVKKEAGPREVADYRSRRCKSKRIKM